MTWNKPLLYLFIVVCAFNSYAQDSKDLAAQQLDRWHQAAAEADFETYFDLMASPGVFVGTDATEHWELEAFKSFSKPYFDQGKAWSFTPLERHMYLTTDGATAFFDELLETHMGICRGSGVLTNEKGSWKVAHYVLSIAVPNEQVDVLKKLTKERNSELISNLKKQN